ncbi:6-phosphogluconolactonase [Thalassobius sp. I31.1]|uniref:6-phosphogluconolactonase n=1 Tax=Thalassobius sp. I31.1 TaxID=2109912 RepID=UPI000D1B7A34|nr:6-phosphogluconolactonase [Thalassobius sp. I31.1]
MKITEYADAEMMMIEVAQEIASDLETALEANGKASFAVPGGTTPAPLFDVLCAADIDWANVTVVQTDERWVPDSSPRSNAKLIREHLLADRAAHAKFVSLYNHCENPEDEIEETRAKVADLLPLSVVLLGVGADMHTASLFPGGDNLALAIDPAAPLVMPMRVDSQDEPRITLTEPALNSAMHKHIVVTGAEKKAALEQAQGLSGMKAPVTKIWGGARIHWAES